MKRSAVAVFMACIVLYSNIYAINKEPASNTVASEVGSISNSDDIYAAPSYNKLLPIPDWNRYSGDSAASVSQWFRWWKYLRIKKPILMHWIDGLRLRIYPTNEVCRALFVRGIYDPNVAVAINTILPESGVLIDVGANMGYLSLLATKKIGEDGKIFAIEPSSRDFLRLVDNINLNHLNEIISAYKLAITDNDQQVEITIASDERNGLNTIGSEFSVKGVEKIATEKVDAVTIDKFVDAEKIKKIDVLKLDIEGSETRALHGAKESIMKFRPALILGINKAALASCNTSPKEIASCLKELRYIAYKLYDDSKSFKFIPVEDLEKASANVIFCFHESIVPPTLPQPERLSWTQEVSRFFQN